MKILFALCVLMATAQKSLAQVGETVPILSRGVGGTWQPLQATPQIRLVDQLVQVKLPAGQVHVRSVFQNLGAATTVSMALPESGEVGTPGIVPRGGFLRNLQSKVDGRPVALKMSAPDGLAYDWDYKVLWTQRVKFGRNQTRVLEDSFVSPLATSMIAPEYGAHQHFAFALRSGRAWKGRIHRLRVQFDTRGLCPFSEIEFGPGKPRTQGDKVLWEWRDIEPNFEVRARWWPGFGPINVDGSTAFPRVTAFQNPRTKALELVYPQRKGQSVWVPLRLLKEWLPPSKDKTENDLGQGAYRAMRGVNWGARNVGAEIGSRYLDVTAPGLTQKVAMTGVAYDERGVTMVELGPTVLALGGKVAWDEKHRQIQVKFK